jgi:hypothetical protein
MALFRREEDGKEIELHEDYAVLAEREGFKRVEEDEKPAKKK